MVLCPQVLKKIPAKLCDDNYFQCLWVLKKIPARPCGDDYFQCPWVLKKIPVRLCRDDYSQCLIGTQKDTRRGWDIPLCICGVTKMNRAVSGYSLYSWVLKKIPVRFCNDDYFQRPWVLKKIPTEDGIYSFVYVGF